MQIYNIRHNMKFLSVQFRSQPLQYCGCSGNGNQVQLWDNVGNVIIFLYLQQQAWPELFEGLVYCDVEMKGKVQNIISFPGQFLSSCEVLPLETKPISFTDRVRNEEILHRVKEKKISHRQYKERKLTGFVTSCVEIAF